MDVVGDIVDDGCHGEVLDGFSVRERESVGRRV